MTSPTSPSPGCGPLPKIKRGTCLKGSQAADFGQLVVDAYKTLSIRAICEETGRSYGAIHKILSRAQVTFRKRGYQHPVAADDAVESTP